MKADNAAVGAPVVATPPSDYLKPVFSSNAGLPSGGPGAPPPGPELALAVECGPNKAWFYVGRLCQGSKGPCVLFNGAWLTPNEFQYVSGRETAKDWKRSIRHHGKSMKLLMTKGILAVQPPSCSCDVCQGHAENNNNLDVNKRAAEVAARKAAEAAEAEGRAIEASRGTMGEPETAGQTATERLNDGDAAIDANSPAKESRLTNIIEAIKSKKRRDPGDASAQKENRPNSRPSSRAGKKKHKELAADVVSSADETSQPPSIPEPPTLIPDIQAEPEKIDQSPEPTLVSPDVEQPIETDVAKAEDESVDSDGEVRPETPNDVSRTRGYVWSARKDKKPLVIQPLQHVTSPVESTVDSEVTKINHSQRATHSPATLTQDSHITLPDSKEDSVARIAITAPVPNKVPEEKALPRSPAPPPQQALASPPRENSPAPKSPIGLSYCPAMTKPSSGQDSKPPLLSPSRSITTATASITTPIVSTGSSMLSAPPSSGQRDSTAHSSKEMSEKREPVKDDSPKVYAPINWPPVATDMRSEAKPSSSSCTSSSSHENQSPTKEKPRCSSGDRRPQSPGPKIATKATEMMSSPNYSDYLRHLGRVPAAPPPGVDEESYVAIMRRCYEWYELSRLYGSYGLPPSGPPPSAQAAMPRSALAPSPYDPHGCLMSSMVHPYYFQHPATAADPYRALGASLPADWSGMAALSDREREAMMMRASEEKEVSGAGVSGLGLKRSYPGELTREEALDLSVNKKRKLAESLAARDGALLYGLHGLRPPFPLSGTGAPVYPGLGSLEVAAAYPGLWGLPHSHPGASLSHPLTSTGGSPHPGLHYPHHSSAATSSCTATSSSSSVSKDHLHPHGHRDATSDFRVPGVDDHHASVLTVEHLTQNVGVKGRGGHQRHGETECDMCCHCVHCHAQQTATERKS